MSTALKGYQLTSSGNQSEISSRVLFLYLLSFLLRPLLVIVVPFRGIREKLAVVSGYGKALVSSPAWSSLKWTVKYLCVNTRYESIPPQSASYCCTTALQHHVFYNFRTLLSGTLQQSPKTKVHTKKSERKFPVQYQHDKPDITQHLFCASSRRALGSGI